MKENWRMYRANRQKQLRSVGLGPHGETVRQLLQPGFHSGTVPRLYARLRQAEDARGFERQLAVGREPASLAAEVNSTIRRLRSRVGQAAAREHALEKRSAARRQSCVDADVRQSACGSRSAFRVPPAGGRAAVRPVRLEWEDQAGWLVASIREPGWLESLRDESTAGGDDSPGWSLQTGRHRSGLRTGARVLPPGASFTLTERGLVVETGPLREAAVRYDLRRSRRRPLKPRRSMEQARRQTGLSWIRRALLFAQVPLSWQQWVESWQGSPDGKPPRTLFSSSIKLLPAGFGGMRKKPDAKSQEPSAALDGSGSWREVHSVVGETVITATRGWAGRFRRCSAAGRWCRGRSRPAARPCADRSSPPGRPA